MWPLRRAEPWQFCRALGKSACVPSTTELDRFSAVEVVLPGNASFRLSIQPLDQQPDLEYKIYYNLYYVIKILLNNMLNI